MEHPKVLLWSVIVLALIVAVMYYFSMSGWGSSDLEVPSTSGESATIRKKIMQSLSIRSGATTTRAALSSEQKAVSSSLKEKGPGGIIGKTETQQQVSTSLQKKH